MAIPTYKDIVDLMKKGATVEAQEKIMELREAVIELQDQNLALRQRLAELDAEIKLKRDTEFDGAAYWCVEEGTRSGPYCQRCCDADGKLVRLQDYGDVWYCLHCKQSHEKIGKR